MEKIFLETFSSYKTIFEKSLDPILLINTGKFVFCNFAALKFLKITSIEELQKKSTEDFLPKTQPNGKDSIKELYHYLEKVKKDGSAKFQLQHLNSLGEPFWVNVSAISIEIAGENFLHVTWHDLSAQKKAEDDLRNINDNLNNIIEIRNQDLLHSVKLLEEYKKALDVSSIVSKTDPKGIITYVNQEFIDISGYSQEELLGQPHNIIRHPDTDPLAFKELWDTIQSKKIWKGVVQNRNKAGESYFVKSTVLPILDKNGNIKEYIGIRVDVTEIYKQQQIIQNQKKDSLTKLPNRIQLLEDIKECSDTKLALINIDRFRDLNDTYGHEIGDKLLKKFATQLAEKLPESTTIYRLYGDEFGILGTKNISRDDFVKLCQTIVKVSRYKSFTYKDYDFELPIRVGITFSNDNPLVQAEIAITMARESSNGLFVLGQDASYKERLENNILWTKKIKGALKEKRFAIFSQDIIPLKEGLPFKCEALVRMIDEDGKVVSPFFFLDIAKKSRLYPEISKFVINESFKKLSNKEKNFSINLTTDDIVNKTIVNQIVTLLRNFGGENVIFEIVESEGIENFGEVKDFIRTVKELGATIAIDDFGTGYSNFEYLVKLDVDTLKVDGSLIKNIHTEKHLRSTVEAIVTFAKGIGLKTVAEFVHCQEVLDIVKELDFD